jgi:hypothetical protein
VSRHIHMHIAKDSQRPCLRHRCDRAYVRMHDQKPSNSPRCIHSPPACRSPWPNGCSPDIHHRIPLCQTSPCTCPPGTARMVPRSARKSLRDIPPDNALPMCSLDAMYTPPDSRHTRFPAGMCLTRIEYMALLQVLGSPLCTCTPSCSSSPTPTWSPQGTADTSFPKSHQAPPSMYSPGTARNLLSRSCPCRSQQDTDDSPPLYIPCRMCSRSPTRWQPPLNACWQGNSCTPHSLPSACTCPHHKESRCPRRRPCTPHCICSR